MTIIKPFDNEDYAYSWIEIKDGALNYNIFIKLLENYKKKNEGSYNFDDFVELLSKSNIFIRTIVPDYEVFF